MPSCFDFFKNPPSKSGYILTTLDLRDLINATGSNENAAKVIEALKNELPLASNYIADLSEKEDPKIYKCLKEFCQSTLTIDTHIKLKDLTSECKLLLNENQFNYLNQLKLINKKVSVQPA